MQPPNLPGSPGHSNRDVKGIKHPLSPARDGRRGGEGRGATSHVRLPSPSQIPPAHSSFPRTVVVFELLVPGSDRWAWGQVTTQRCLSTPWAPSSWCWLTPLLLNGGKKRAGAGVKGQITSFGSEGGFKTALPSLYSPDGVTLQGEG